MYRKTVGCAGLIIFCVVLLLCLLGPVIAPHDPISIGDASLQPPGRVYWLGTNELGQDLFSRVLCGGKNSIFMAIIGASVSVFIGTLLGMIAAYYGGGIDRLLSRSIDILMVIPMFPLIILFSVYYSPSLYLIGLIMGILGWGPCARIVRSQALSLTQWNFVQGARAMGASNGYILFRYIFPFVFPLSIVKLVLTMQGYLLMGVGLGFVGLGDAGSLDWGQMLHRAYAGGALSIGCWWLLMVPIMAVVIFSLSIALIGYGLDGQFDPLLDRAGRLKVER